MRRAMWVVVGLVIGSWPLAAVQAEDTLPAGVIEKLHRGELSAAEQQLRRRLADDSKDDNARFALGFVQVLRTFERTAQFHWEYGAKTRAAITLLPLSVKSNLEPNAISYRAWRRGLEMAQQDLLAAEATLAAIQSDDVRVPLPLAQLQWDPDGDGKAERWTAMSEQLAQQVKGIAGDNPDLLVSFDRADVYWLRGYCHLAAGMMDVILAMDGQAMFDASADFAYERPTFSAEAAGLSKQDRQNRLWQRMMEIPFAERDRWSIARGHWLKVTELSRQMWDAAERETDNDHEWLPNARQKGAINIPVTDEMIAAWRDAMRELQGILKGEKLIRSWKVSPEQRDKQGINLRKFMDTPPKELKVFELFLNGMKDYQEEGTVADDKVFQRLDEVFGGNTLGFALWFN